MAHGVHAAVTKLLIEARCDIDLQQMDGATPSRARRNRHADTEHKAKRCQGCSTAGLRREDQKAAGKSQVYLQQDKKKGESRE
jgi:hypothetical protein